MTDPEPAGSQTPAGSPAPAASETTVGPPKRPWWVKAFIVVAILAAVFLILSLAGILPGGPGRHGPGRHGQGDGSPARQTVTAGLQWIS